MRTRTAQVDVRLIVAVTLCLLITVGLWWIYFDRFARIAEERLRSAREPVLAASDAYSYLHLIIIAGVIIFAVGARLVAGGAPLSDAGWLALCGGVALYLAGLVGASWRLIGSFDVVKSAAALALLSIGLWAPAIATWGAAALVTGVLAAVCVVDAVRLV